ncbi:MAG TPA: bifunctional diaminohydroxyphosphoribosylaminopyrimidine deaminase/5-amino-6-(5-phosphoribosylamino)uracil reductase RibD [Gammaproteobacteria bacterium]|nr:bifunctional diaminohydroxyphosphoribosylaminopyrimidine deaminase/5-amino-6-(5-phosphoribosylamino)uracil reductase RibD [Gammaproteobacteria bacterium]
MRRALELAGRGLYTADPNPRVGCVLVKGDRVVGEGWHAVAGGPHAERAALAAAGAEARGATAYVTLEPCNHTGRTGPCTSALIEAGIARVVAAMRDPNPQVAGGGIEALEKAGVGVELGLLEVEARALNPGYLSRVLRGRPLIRSKLAASLDGRTALANGVSRWITGSAARADVHRWRARSSAVLTGIGTLLADDPSLNARLDDPTIDVRQPSRVVIDSALRSPAGARMFALPGEAIAFTTSSDAQRTAELVDRGVRVERVPGAGHGCDLAAVARRLGELGHNEVWVEAGPKLNGALLAAGLIDELIIYFAPLLFGDAARGMFDLGKLTTLEQCPRLVLDDLETIGTDLRLVARPANVRDA